MQEFENDENVLAHQRQLEECSLVNKPPDDPRRGFDKIQETQIRSRKRRDSQTEEDKWNDIYLILFPGEENALPSPCMSSLNPIFL